MLKTYSSSSSLVITSRWFATSRLAVPAFVRLVYCSMVSIIIRNILHLSTLWSISPSWWNHDSTDFLAIQGFFVYLIILEWELSLVLVWGKGESFVPVIISSAIITFTPATSMLGLAIHCFGELPKSIWENTYRHPKRSRNFSHLSWTLI